jgi:hypothetical protein
MLGHERVGGEKVPADWTAPHSFAQSFKGSAQDILLDPPQHTLDPDCYPNLPLNFFNTFRCVAAI